MRGEDRGRDGRGVPFLLHSWSWEGGWCLLSVLGGWGEGGGWGWDRSVSAMAVRAVQGRGKRGMSVMVAEEGLCVGRGLLMRVNFSLWALRVWQ